MAQAGRQIAGELLVTVTAQHQKLTAGATRGSVMVLCVRLTDGELRVVTSWHGGKGDRQRACNVSAFNDNFDRIFRKPAGSGINEDDKHGDDARSKSKKESGGATKGS